MFAFLEKYTDRGYYEINQDTTISRVCNAPTDKIGVYIVYNIEKKCVIYIGRSGKLDKDGNPIVRKVGYGGIKDRLINGHQFGKVPRRRSWIEAIKYQGIKKIGVFWFVTYDNKHMDSPVDVEKHLLNIYLSIYGELPVWNKIL